MELTVSWIEQGRQEGLQEGRQEGLQQILILLTHQIERRIGALDPTIQERVRSLSMDQLMRLGEVIYDIDNVVDLNTWMTTNA
jgi:predicted transposase YdaD